MMTEDQIRATVSEEIRRAVGFADSELSNQRKQALEYYYGEPFGNEVEGMSSYVSRDVADTIEWIMPSLMRIFAGGDTIVRFEPQGPEDEQGANQATDFVNYVFQRQNDGFLVLNTWFKDALISKNGFVKVYWDKYTQYKTETYDNLLDDEFAKILQDKTVEPIEHTESVDELGNKVHALKVKKKAEIGKCCVIPVPPEEVVVNQNPIAPLKRNRFVAHRRKVTISELREMGYEGVDDLTSFEGTEEFNLERQTRYQYDETDTSDHSADKSLDPSQKSIWLAECYLKLDVDGDGIAELRKITVAGNRLLDNEEVDSCPFVTLTPIPLPHKLFGMSVADLVMDLQLLKSTVFRQVLDNMYLANNGRYMALDGMVNIDDLLTNRAGGIIRVKTFDAVKPIQPPLLGAPAFSLLEYIDTIKDKRTGVNETTQGLDRNTLNKTASGMNMLMTAAQSRIELIARVFAETGVKDLFYAMLECVQKHTDRAQIVRLRNEWVEMDPREWTSRFDMSVAVGLGTGTKEMQMAAIQQVVQLQMTALQAGIPMVTPENFYHSANELMKASSLKGGDLFFTHPSKVPQQNQPDPKMVEAQAKLQLQAQKQEMAAQQKQQKMESDFALKAETIRQDALRNQLEYTQKSDEARIDVLVERMKMDAQRQMAEAKMAIDAMLKREAEALRAESEEKDRKLEERIAAESEYTKRMENAMSVFTESVKNVVDIVSKPKKVVRDNKGKVVGVE